MDVLNVAFDIDGVIANTYPIIKEEIELECGYRVIDNNTWNIIVPDEYNLDFDKVINNALNKYEKIEPFACAKVYLPLIYKSLNKKIIFITARHKDTYWSTKKWLDIHFSNIKYKLIFEYNKVKPIYEFDITYFIEDRLKTANCLANHLNHMILINRYYNMGRFTHPHIKRMENIKDVYEHLTQEKTLCDKRNTLCG